jgi:hypothetical protein
MPVVAEQVLFYQELLVLAAQVVAGMQVEGHLLLLVLVLLTQVAAVAVMVVAPLLQAALAAAV